jgi:hypothetical protein
MCSGIISHRIQLFLQQRGMPQPFRFGKGFCFRSPLVNVYSMIIVKRHRCMNRCQRQLILARNLCQRLPLLQGHERNICHRDSGSSNPRLATPNARSHFNVTIGVVYDWLHHVAASL